MPENINSNLPGENNQEASQNKDASSRPDRFQSDTQKIVRRHMEDPDHQITDEEMQNMRVGMNPPELDEVTEARLEGEDAVDEVEKKILSDRKDIDEDQNTSGDKITPWDIVDPK